MKKKENESEENIKKKDQPKKKENENINEKEEEQLINEEEDKIEYEENLEKLKKNIVLYFNQLFYESAINRVTDKKRKYSIQNIIGLFEKEYKNNFSELNVIDNEYYYLFEITFYCIYLNLIEIYYKNKNNFRREISFIFDLIEKFLTTYETYSLYINFIEEEGAKTFIKNKYDELYDYLPSFIKLYPKTYKSTKKLRKYLLKNKIFKYYGNEYINIIEKNINFVNNEKTKEKYSSLKENEIEALNISINEIIQFYKGEKAKEVKNFYEKIDYDKKDNKQRNKFFNDIVNNYLSIIE